MAISYHDVTTRDLAFVLSFVGHDMVKDGHNITSQLNLTLTIGFWPNS